MLKRPPRPGQSRPSCSVLLLPERSASEVVNQLIQEVLPARVVRLCQFVIGKVGMRESHQCSSPFFSKVKVTVDSSPKVYRDIQVC